MRIRPECDLVVVKQVVRERAEIFLCSCECVKYLLLGDYLMRDTLSLSCFPFPCFTMIRGVSCRLPGSHSHDSVMFIHRHSLPVNPRRSPCTQVKLFILLHAAGFHFTLSGLFMATSALESLPLRIKRLPIHISPHLHIQGQV